MTEQATGRDLGRPRIDIVFEGVHHTGHEIKMSPNLVKEQLLILATDIETTDADKHVAPADEGTIPSASVEFQAMYSTDYTVRPKGPPLDRGQLIIVVRELRDYYEAYAFQEAAMKAQAEQQKGRIARPNGPLPPFDRGRRRH